MKKIYEDADIYIEWEPSEIPWVKIFTQEPYKELSDCPDRIANKLWQIALITEKAMIDYFEPDKINIASFGNYTPRVHIHVMARFTKDSFFPEPMWGTKQRESDLHLPDVGPFEESLRHTIEERIR